MTLHITGTLRSAPMDAIDVCMDVMPFHLLVEKLMYRAATRLATLPSCHPLAKHTVHVVNRYVRQHRAPLHKILHALEFTPMNLS